jgi:DNA-binding CsgD family transcriptional regulator
MPFWSRTVSEAAEQLGVQANTVRMHLKRVYMKTTTTGQSELVSLLLSGVAALHRP